MSRKKGVIFKIHLDRLIPRAPRIIQRGKVIVPLKGRGSYNRLKLKNDLRKALLNS